jgi:K+-transporting ATPase ATPase C chain
MKTIVQDFISAIMATVLLAVICCGLYPVVVWGISQAAFSHQANGSLIETADHQIIGSEWIGQRFTLPQYFHPRPSAAGNGYDAANSGGSNLGPTSQKLMDAVKQRVADYRKENNLAPGALVPCDAVTASGSGLDPHISVQNALLQAPRVAAVRHLALDAVKSEIARATEAPSLGILGEPGVNVLTLNLTLDKASH